MSTNKKNIIYTAVDIEKYFSGQLSSAGMHEMEKAALDDPFLAEAMEGYEGVKGKDWKGTLAALHRQIAEAGSEAKVIPMHRSTGKWWKTAAAVLVIGSGAALTFILTQNKREEKPAQQIAQTITTAPDSNSTNNKVAPPAQTQSTLTTSPPAKEKNTSANGTIAQVSPQGDVKDNNAPFKQQNTAAADSLKTNDAVLANAGKATAPASTTINAPSTVANNTIQGEEMVKDKKAAEKNNNDAEAFKRQAAIQNRKEQSANNYFIAQVVAADNSPLPFTNISIRAENFGTYADVKGNFRLVSPDTALNIEVRSVGYKPRTFLLKSNQPLNKIVLLEDEMVAREKTVIQNKDISSNKKIRRARLLIDSVVNVEPKDGWDNYNTYVANNIEIPDDILKKESHGEVEVVFDVNANGVISNIRINKSLGPEYDEAAKRLIMQGPQWKVKKGKKTSASVKVQF